MTWELRTALQAEALKMERFESWKSSDVESTIVERGIRQGLQPILPWLTAPPGTPIQVPQPMLQTRIATSPKP